MLTGRKRIFFEEYKKDRNGARSAEAAGYAKKSARQRAYKLLHSDEAVMAAVKDWEEELHRERTAERNEIVEFLTSVMRGEEVDTVPLTVRGVQELQEGKPSAKDRLKAAEMLGRYYNIFDGAAQTDGDDASGVVLLPEVINDE